MKKKGWLSLILSLVPFVVALTIIAIFMCSSGNWAWLIVLLYSTPITTFIFGGVSVLLSVLAMCKRRAGVKYGLALGVGVVDLLIAFTLAFAILR